MAPRPLNNQVMEKDTARTASEGPRVNFLYWGMSGNTALMKRSFAVHEGTTLGDLLDTASPLTGTDLRAETAREGTRFITVNGAYCVVPRDLDRRLEDGDEIALLPFVAGG